LSTDNPRSNSALLYAAHPAAKLQERGKNREGNNPSACSGYQDTCQ